MNTITVLAWFAMVCVVGTVVGISYCYIKGIDPAILDSEDEHKKGFEEGFKAGYVMGHRKGTDKVPDGCLDLRPVTRMMTHLTIPLRDLANKVSCLETGDDND